MNLQSRWGVVCDFDGTISKSDATDAILAAFAHPDWLEIEKSWVGGEIGSRDCLGRQIGCLDASIEQMNSLIDRLPIDPTFPAFVSFCQARSIPLVIVSDGLDYVIQRILAREGIGGVQVFANQLTPLAPASFTIEFPHSRSNCKSGVCKCATLQQLRRLWSNRRLLFVGDGRSDFCAAANSADLVAAKSVLLDHLSAQGKPCVAYQAFNDIQAIIDQLDSGLKRYNRGQKYACA